MHTSRNKTRSGRETFFPGRIACLIVMTVYAGVIAAAQSGPSDYQPGTITAVAPHAQMTSSQHQQYDVSVKVGDTVYTVLYTPPPGVDSVKYYAGLQLLVMPRGDKLVFNSRLTGSTEVPILHRETSPSSGLDWSKAPSQYYSMKLQNLTDSLGLSPEQQSRVKPILAQEAAGLNVLWGNPSLSTKEKLQRLEQAVRSSDEQIKPILSREQLEKLQAMRQEQEQEVKRRLEEQKPDREE